ncbi:MAG: M23 family metallopeptidase [Thermoanaerobaculia bacterium]
MASLLIAIVTLLVMLVPTVWIVVARPGGRTVWAPRVLLAAALVTLGFLLGNWAVLGIWTRIGLAGLFLVAVLVSFVRARRVGRDSAGGGRTSFAITIIAVVILLVDLAAIASRIPPAGAVDLAFPFHSGTFVVTQGGRGPLTNPFHFWTPAEQYGLDLVRVGKLGVRARGVAPKELKEYATWGEPVFSPCTGRVVDEVSRTPEAAIGSPDASVPAGNYVILDCSGTNVVLAHLKRGAVFVRPGDSVLEGERIAKVGNSGYTSEPQLHLSASRTEGGRQVPVPVRFEGAFLTQNDVVRVEGESQQPAIPAAQVPQ